MKTKSLLFTIITGAIFNTYAFAGQSENVSINNADSQFVLVEMNDQFISTEDTLKSSNQPETNQETETSQLSEREKRATAAVCVIAGLMGTSVSIVYFIGRSVMRDLNDLQYDRHNGWH